MRKLLVLALLASLCACASSGAATGMGLDAAIQQASKDINDSLPAGTKVALINFTSPSDVFSDYVLEEMSISLVKERKLVVVDRKEIDLIRREMNFQMSGEVSDASAQEIGAMLGAQSIVSGSLVNMGDAYRFRTKVINVNSAAIQTSSSITFNDSPQIQHLLSQGSAKAAAQTAPQAPSSTQTVTNTQTQPAAPAVSVAPKVYKIGDTGPAGGLIFYDKGNNSGGWRYLEAAPAEAEFQAPWSIRLGSVNNMVNNTQGNIGSGKQNTRLIAEKLKQSGGEWDSAAIKILELEYSGFSDWFLPSSGELDQMYGNLKRRDLGGFSDDWYWSSTEYQQGPDVRWGVTVQNFSDNQISVASVGIFSDGRSKKFYVRPIRQVSGN